MIDLDIAKPFCASLGLKVVVHYDKPKSLDRDCDLVYMPDTVAFANNQEGVEHIINLAQRGKYLYTAYAPMSTQHLIGRAFRICWRDLTNGFYQSRLLLPRVSIYPTQAMMSNSVGGVKRVIDSLYAHLPAHGFEVIDSDPDFVHAHATFIHDRAAVYTNHGMHSWGTTDPRLARQNEEIATCLQQARYITAVSQVAPAVFEHRLHVKAQVIPNGVDLEEFDRLLSGDFINTYRITKPYFLWAKVTKNDVCDPKPGLILANMMRDHQFVFTFTDGLVTSNVMTVGPLEYAQAKAAIKDCAMLLATTKENFSIQTLEAMACAKPVLAFDHGGAREAVIHRETGYLAKDQDDLYRGAQFCLEHADELGQRGRAVVESNFTWRRHVVPKIADLYRRVIKDRVEELRHPLVTVVITNYNMHKWLGEAIDSVLLQSFTDFELIVIDDGSTEQGFDAVMKRFGDARIKIIKQKNQGVAAARNNAIRSGKGRYVCCLDADDVIRVEFLEKLVPVIEGHTGCGIAYCDFEMFGTSQGVVKMHPHNFESLKRSNHIPCCNLFRRTAWERTGGYKELIAWEDYELWLHICKLGFGATYIPGPYFMYRKKGEEGRDAAGHGREAEIRAQFATVHPDLYPTTISVIIPSYNHAHYLGDSIGSVLRQTFQDFEIIVVDDGSSDTTACAEAIKHFKDPRIRIVQHETNKGLAEARNTGIRASHGKYIFTLDADDKIKGTCFQEMHNLLESDAQTDIAYCDVELFGTVSKQLMTQEYDFEELLKRNIFLCASLYRRKVFDDCNGYNPNMHYGWEDYDFWVNAGKRGHCGRRIPKVLFMYRRDRRSMLVESQEHIEEMRRQLHANHPELFYEGRRPVGCCGKARRQAPKVVYVAPTPSIGQAPLIEVSYTGSRPVAIRGAITNATYEFVPKTVRLVDSRDVDSLVTSKFFKRTGSNVPETQLVGV